MATIVTLGCNTIDQLNTMFDCLCSAQSRNVLSSRSKFYKAISATLCREEISILSLIYEDLASRNQENKMTYQNFLSFFDLTGLWGVKLFQQFDQDKQSLITFEQFLYGISQTAKATFEQKIKLLYSFFEDDINSGIEFRQFVKMLYNYSKEQLKEILLQDKTMQDYRNSELRGDNNVKLEDNVYELNAFQSENHPKPATAFDFAYEALLKNHDEGTYLEVNENELKYKIKYCNMSTLVKDFALKVYNDHNIDVEGSSKARLSYQDFCNWIKSHKKLFKSYYSAFHTEIWTVEDGEPRYMQAPVELEFVGKIQFGKNKMDVYGFQVEDVIIFCESRKTKFKPIKIICLEGLSIKDAGNNCIQISHRSDFYKNCTLIFRKPQQHQVWLANLAIYQRESLNINYITKEMIGTGKFSIVYKCIERATNKVYALKLIELDKLTKTAREMISNQSEILKILNHPQILKYINTIYTKTHEYIITEYIYGEDLYEYVKKRRFLNEFESAFIIGNIMKAVMYLHELEIMHRDLKPENIMVMFKNMKHGEYFEATSPQIRKGQRVQNIKIIDFGLSNHLSKLQKMEKKRLVSGTPNYIAPEILRCEQLTLRSDTFAIGSILYFLLKGTLPFADVNAEKTLLNTVAGRYDITSEHWDEISDEAKDLLTRMLEVDPNQRIDLKQAVNHEWFNLILNKRRSNLSSNSSVSDTTESPKQVNDLDDVKLEIQDAPKRKVSTSQTKRKGLNLSLSLK